LARKTNPVSYLISLMCQSERPCATTSSFYSGMHAAHAQVVQDFRSDILPTVLCQLVTTASLLHPLYILAATEVCTNMCDVNYVTSQLSVSKHRSTHISNSILAHILQMEFKEEFYTSYSYNTPNHRRILYKLQLQYTKS